MSSEHDCVAGTHSNEMLQENQLLDHNAHELNNSVFVQQKILTNELNTDMEQLKALELPSISGTTFSSLGSMQEKVNTEDCTGIGMYPIIKQTENSKVHSSIAEGTSTLDELKSKYSCDSQDYLPQTEIKQNSASYTKENFYHLDGQNLLNNVSNINSKELCSSNDVYTAESSNSKIKDDGDIVQIEQNYNAIVKHENQLKGVEQANFNNLISLDEVVCHKEPHDEKINLNKFSDKYEPTTFTLLQNGDDGTSGVKHSESDIKSFQNKQKCLIKNSESGNCIYINSTESVDTLVLDSENEQSASELNGSCEINASSNSQIPGSGGNTVMQTFVEGTLQPLSISSCENTESVAVVDDEDSSSLFAGVSQELISLDNESSNVLEIIGNSSVKAVKLESDITTENAESEPSFIDLSTPVNINSSLCPLESAILNQESSCMSTEFGHILELDGKPTYMKLLPLKNGHALWNMHDLRLAVSQHGTVLLRLCASPNSMDRNVTTSQCNFSALFLDDDIPPSNSSDVFQCSNLANANKSKSTETRSCQTNFDPIHSATHLAPVNCNSSMSGYSYGLDTSDVQDSKTIRHMCLPPPMSNLNYSVQAARGKKRGRPPLHNKGEVVGSISAYSSMMEGASIPFKISKKRSSMDSLWKKYQKLQKTEPKVSNDQTTFTAEEDREMSLGYKKLLSLTCVQCGAIFRNKGALSTHVKSKHRVFKKCRICQARIHMQDKYSLRRHLIKAHKNRDQLMCTKCNVSFKVMLHLKRHDRVIHESSESSDISSCEVGSESDDEDDCCLDDSAVLENRKNVEGAECLPEKVDIAEAMDQSKQSIQNDNTAHSESESDEAGDNDRHLRSSAVPKNVPSSTTGSSEESSDSDESESDSDVEDDKSTNVEATRETNKFMCKKCDVGFSDKIKLKNHISGHTISKDNGESSLYSDVVTSKSNKQIDSDSEPGSDKENTKLSNALAKDKVSRGQTSPKFTRACTRSGKYFSQDSAMTNHNSFSKKKPPKTMKSSADEALDSNNEKSSKLTKSNRPSYIIRRGRMFYCNKCNISFKREKMMTYHLKKIHETLYPFRACPDCGKVFRSCGPFNRHLSQHKFTYCPVDGCKAKYRNIRLVKKHQKKGHPDLPHRCHRCVHLFKKKNQLNQHIHEAHIHAKNEEDDEKEEDLSEEEEPKKIKIIRAKSKDYVPTIISGKRDRHEPVSYKELEEEEFSGRRGAHPSLKRNASQSVDVTPTASVPNKKLKPTKLKTKVVHTTMKSKIFLKRLDNVKLKSEYKTKKHITLVTKNKKITTSWTAALKAKYQANKLPKKITVDVVNKSSKPKNSHSSSPGITDDVIRRVSDSLLSRKPAEIKKPKPDKKLPHPDNQSAGPARRSESAISSRDSKHCTDLKPTAASGVKSSNQTNEKPANILQFDLF